MIINPCVNAIVQFWTKVILPVANCACFFKYMYLEKNNQ